MDFGHLGVPGQVVVELKLDKNFANEYVLSHKMEENLALEQKTLKQDIVDLKVVCIFFSKYNNFSWCFVKNYFVRISNLASLAILFHKFIFQYISKNAIIFE